MRTRKGEKIRLEDLQRVDAIRRGGGMSVCVKRTLHCDLQLFCKKHIKKVQKM